MQRSWLNYLPKCDNLYNFGGQMVSINNFRNYK
jgi:hypothetical protein